MSTLSTAIEEAGGLGALAEACGVRYQAIQKWRRTAVPEDRCPAIELATAGKVRCEDLRPDVEWQRDDAGQVTGYHVRIVPPDQQAAA